MEDATTFDVWALIDPSKRTLALSVLRELEPGVSRLEIHRFVASALSAGLPACIVQGIGWSEAQRNRERLREIAKVIEVSQAGYDMNDQMKMQRCHRHCLLYGGCLGCPVCEGRNLP